MSDDDPLLEQSRPRRRWKRWVFGLPILMVLFLLWAKGPGIRWATEKAIIHQLEKQGLVGSFQIHGDALEGLSITHLSLTGSSKIQNVQSDRIQIDWSFDSLRRKEIEAITIEKLHVVIDPEAPDLPSDDKEELSPEEAEQALRETLELVRNSLKPTTIHLSDLELVVKDTSTLSLASLSHAVNSDQYLLSDLRTRDHLDRPIHNPFSTLTWTEGNFAIDRFQLFSQLGLQNLNFQLGEMASSEILIGDSQLTFTSDLKNAHQLSLDSPSLSLSELAQLGKPELDISGTITDLQIDTATGFINIQGQDLRYEDKEISSASIQASTADLLSPYDQPVKIKVTLDQQLVLAGTVILSEENPLNSQADLAFTLRDPRIPTITGEISYDSREARVKASALDGLQLKARYFLDSETYEAEASSNLQDAGQLDENLTGPLKFTLNAKGSIADETHSGTLKLTEIKASHPEFADTQTEATITYDWPQNVIVDSLKITKPEGYVQAQLKWEDDQLTVSQLDLIENGTKLFTATAKLPAPLDTEKLDNILDSTEPISLVIKSQPLSFKKLSSFVPIPEGLGAVFQADLILSGSIAKPNLGGYATIDDCRISSQPDLPPLDLDLRLETLEQQLIITARASEPGGPLFDLDGKIPFLPRAWIERKTKPNDSPLDIRITSPKLDLRRVKPFVPMVKQIDGTTELDVIVSGTISSPQVVGLAKTRIATMRVIDAPITSFRNVNFDTSFSGDVISIQSENISAAGGLALVSGTIDISGPEPVLDIHFDSEHLLLHRTPEYTFRGHTDINLRGPFSTAAVTGSVSVVESLFYKDIEILPFGTPSTTDIPEPNLPTFTTKIKTTEQLEEESLFDNWTLDLDIATGDPVLIRGNLARGEISGNIKVTGTIGDPKTAGTLTTKDVSADLPFSDLKILTGTVTLRNEDITNPLVNIRGSSVIGQYTVQVFVTGPVQNPTLILTSDPPLPESEIMLLLATGSASSQLEDRQVASQKALQYLLEGLRRRNREKDKSVFQRLLKNSDQIELSLGDTNQFSGRTFSSATLKITDQWNFTTQIDEFGQTRALVVFSIRIR